jgi:hypothetical protein
MTFGEVAVAGFLLSHGRVLETAVNVSSSSASPVNETAALAVFEAAYNGLSGTCQADLQAFGDEYTSSCVEPSVEPPSICDVGTTSECANLQVAFDYLVCEALDIGGFLAELYGCQKEEVIKFAGELYYGFIYATASACPNGPQHVCFSDGSVNPQQTFEIALAAATGSGDGGVPDFFFKLSPSCQLGLTTVFGSDGSEGNTTTEGNTDQSGTDTDFEPDEYTLEMCGLMENGAQTKAFETITALMSDKTGLCNAKGSVNDFGDNCADVAPAVEALMCVMAPQIAAVVEPVEQALDSLVTSGNCTEAETDMIFEYFIGSMPNLIEELVAQCGGPPHPCFSQKSLKAAKKAAAKELSSGKLEKYSKKDLVDYLNNTAPFVVPSFTALGLSASVLMA